MNWWKWIFIVLVLVCCMGTGPCEKKREFEQTPTPECTCPRPPKDYMVNLQYESHEGVRSFPHLVEWDRGYGFERIPDTMSHTIGMSPGREDRHYYSFKVPRRVDNGLIRIDQVDGAAVYVDFKDIEVTLIPCKPKETGLVQSMQDEEYRWKDYRDNKCPYRDWHGRRYRRIH